MAKLFSFVPLELQTGADEQEFIKFFSEQYAPLIEKFGWKSYVLKADRGERNGKLAVIYEISSVEQRDRFVPSSGLASEEALRLLGSEALGMNEKLNTYVVGWPFTDYVVLDE